MLPLLLTIFILKQHPDWLKPLKPKPLWDQSCVDYYQAGWQGLEAGRGEWGASFHPSTCQCLSWASPITQIECHGFLQAVIWLLDRSRALHSVHYKVFSIWFQIQGGGWVALQSQMFELLFNLVEWTTDTRLVWRRLWRITSRYAIDDLRPQIS